MLFYLHYMLMTSGLSGTSVLLAVYFKTYTDASQSEIGALLMTFPFVCLIIKPLFCSMADRHQAHRLYLIIALLIEMLGYLPFAIIPFFPSFYQQYPRISWYVLIIGCHLGNGGLGVAWSLGDCLAVNYSQKTGTPFGRMRLMGTLSWGLYGFIIGQINEVPQLPKYIPAFFILHLSLIVELAMVVLWKREDFEMVDPLASLTGTNTPAIAVCQPAPAAVTNTTPASANVVNANGDEEPRPELDRQLSNQLAASIDHMNSMPSSLGGTLRIQPKTANALRGVLAAEELQQRLKGIEASTSQEEQRTSEQVKTESLKAMTIKIPSGGGGGEPAATGDHHLVANLEAGSNEEATKRNPQLILLKMILIEDGRVIKYICLFTIFGVLMAPMNFLFLSMEELCRERDYNFSQLAGAVLISQAMIETVAFLVVPWCMQYMSKSAALSVGLFIMSAKWIFYSGWYYSSGISPYWAVLSEWSHGISYGVFCTIQADVSLMFANSSRLFIPELRKMGFLSKAETSSKQRVEAEEKSIKMALRATMQALFGGFMDGLGQGAGSLLCGIFIEMYSYVTVWKLFSLITFTAIFLHLLVELTNSRWSDTYKAREGTKASEIMQLSQAYEIESRRKGTKKSPKSSSSSNSNDGKGKTKDSNVEDKKRSGANQTIAVGC